MVAGINIPNMKKVLAFLFSFIAIHTFSQSIELTNWTLLNEPSWDTIPALKKWNTVSTNNKRNPLAVVPGTIYQTLVKNGIIANPILDTNETAAQWVENCDFTYQSAFRVPANFNTSKAIYLKFDGLDTYAEVKLNGKVILRANNMFRTWQVDVSKDLKANEMNYLSIRFESAALKAKKLAAENPITLPGEERVYVRKAQYHFGWDWGPRLAGCGISGKITLVNQPRFSLENLTLETLNISEKWGNIQIKGNIKADTITNVTLKYELFDGADRVDLSTIKMVVFPGKMPINGLLTAQYPKLWSPEHPFLYTAKITVLENNIPVLVQTLKAGIRTISLITDEDGNGMTYTFKLNNHLFFAKGANWIPDEVYKYPFQDSSKLRRSLVQLKANGLNMIRIWGGGVYANDLLMSLCDELGILVWQDFMYACGMYPGNREFIENAREEAIENVIRLHKYASLALFCGNNEISEGWNNWGWQSQYKYSAKDSIKVFEDYLSLFNRTLTTVVETFAKDISYVSTSPIYGWGRKESMTSGDSHYWGVWWGMEPFERYQTKVPRFMSEFGFQGIPMIESWATIAPKDQLKMSSKVLKIHQKHPTGYETIHAYLLRDYKVPAAAEDFFYVSQLLQARGVGIGLEAQRKSAPYCMGSLFWQWNDCWMVSSWSAVDYTGSPKAMAYKAREMYVENLLSIDTSANGFRLQLTKSTEETQQDSIVKWRLYLKDVSGKVLLDTAGEVNVNSVEWSTTTVEISYGTLKNFNRQSCFVEVEYVGRAIPNRTFWFEKPKDLQLPKSTVKFESRANGSSFELVATPVGGIVKDFWMSEKTGKLTNNFFDLTRPTVVATSSKPFDLVKITWKSLNSIIYKVSN